MRIYLGQSKFIIHAELVSESKHTAMVCLTNGDIIKRHKIRDFVDFEGDKLKDSTEPVEDRKLSLVEKIVKWVTPNRSPKESIC